MQGDEPVQRNVSGVLETTQVVLVESFIDTALYEGNFQAITHIH